jgi:hypothetical protein
MMSEKKQADPAVWIKSVMQDFLDHSPENTLQDKAHEKAFEECLLGFSKGDDPIYDKYKEVVGPFHWTPLEIFTKAFPESKMKAEEITVISWIIPHREAVKADNRKETAFTSERWARARIFGEQVNAKLRKEVVRKRAIGRSLHSFFPIGPGNRAKSMYLPPRGRRDMRLMPQVWGPSVSATA